MSHDRGCFRCFEDHPSSNVGCTVSGCPYREEQARYKANREWARAVGTNIAFRGYTDWFVNSADLNSRD